MKGETMLFQAENRHGPSCGEPPSLDASKVGFASYFENYYGEQWIAEGTKDGTLLVHGGDLGWAKGCEVTLNEAGIPHIAGIVLNQAEYLWLAACWEATSLQRGKDA